jgi:hypothetical protein
MIFGNMSRFSERRYTGLEQKYLRKHQLWRHKREAKLCRCISLIHRAFQFTIYNGPTNALVCNKILIQMSQTKLFKITPTCFDHHQGAFWSWLKSLVKILSLQVWLCGSIRSFCVLYCVGRHVDMTQLVEERGNEGQLLSSLMSSTGMADAVPCPRKFYRIQSPWMFYIIQKLQRLMCAEL